MVSCGRSLLFCSISQKNAACNGFFPLAKRLKSDMIKATKNCACRAAGGMDHGIVWQEKIAGGDPGRGPGAIHPGRPEKSLSDAAQAGRPGQRPGGLLHRQDLSGTQGAESGPALPDRGGVGRRGGSGHAAGPGIWRAGLPAPRRGPRARTRAGARAGAAEARPGPRAGAAQARPGACAGTAEARPCAGAGSKTRTQGCAHTQGGRKAKARPGPRAQGGEQERTRTRRRPGRRGQGAGSLQGGRRCHGPAAF